MLRSRLDERLVSESLVALVAAIFGVLTLLTLRLHAAGDSWLAFAAGREIAHNGLPHHDALAIWTHGTQWVDQQWLGQLAFYSLTTLGGVHLALLVHGFVVIAAYTSALALARWRGGSARHVVWIGLLGAVLVGRHAWNLRTQTFAYLLFVVVLWLLIADCRRPSRRVFWLIPLLVLWSNVHGSIVIGAPLVATAGAVFVFNGLRGGREGLGHGAALIAIAIGSLFASPYALELGSYYHRTVLNSDLKFLPLWQSPHLSAGTAPFFLLGGLALWLMGRAGNRLHAFERLALVLTLIAGLLAMRNTVWFALTAIAIMPAAAELAFPTTEDEQTPAGLARGVSIVAILAVVAAATVAIVRMPFDDLFPTRAEEVAWSAARSDPSANVFADDKYTDWLLWRHPGFAGRIMYDTRFELLSKRRINQLRRFRAQAPGWREALAGARILVLDRKRKPLPGVTPAAAVLAREPGTRTLYSDDDVVVLLRAR